MLKMSEFIDKERSRFSTRDNNRFAMSFSQILRYYDFLSVILNRYKEANKLFIESMKAHKEIFKEGGRPLNKDQQGWLEESWELKTHLHLEIESFYLFAKILLDSMARNIELYFGKDQNCSFHSHGGLSKHIKDFVARRKLTTLPTEMLALIEELEEYVIRYRNKQIVHPDDKYWSRIIKGTMCNGLKEESCIVNTYLYPEEGENQVESKSPFEIIKLIDKYLEIVVEYLSTNRDKTIFELATS